MATSAQRKFMFLDLGEHTMRESLRNALVVTRREVRDSFRDWRIMVPIFVLTLVFPLLANNMTSLFTNFFEKNGASPLINNFLPLLPMIVGFFPVSISLVIALETFVGEKERRSLEPLLSTPLTNTELYIGKTLAAMIPPLMASYVGMSIYLGALIFGKQQWRPEPELILQIMILTTAQALIMVTGAVVVSSQTTSTRASNLLASFIIIPISLLVMLESFIMVTNNRYVLWYIVLGLMVADVMLFGMGARLFNREELLGRSIDEINLKWAWKLFAQHFTGGARTPIEWYKKSVLPALPRLRGAMIIVAISIVGAFICGFVLTQIRPDLRIPFPESANPAGLADNLSLVFQRLGSAKQGLVLAALWQNVRVLLAATLLATFTFGVLGVIFAITPFGILGFLIGHPVIASVGIATLTAAFLPHSLFEIPAVIIAVAAAVRLGAVITRPPQGEGVWDAWLRALADLIKLWIGLVLPLLVVAAFVEVYITPIVVQMVINR